MYESLNAWVIGFHGCDRSVAERILSGSEHLLASTNSFDWLGSGIYFWEHNFERAFEFACQSSSRPKSPIIDDPYVIGAILDLGRCLNLLQSDKSKLLKDAYSRLVAAATLTGQKIPENKSVAGRSDKPLRYLDCAVIEMIHDNNAVEGQSPYDTVRGAFWEGDEPYPNAGFRSQDHIQICVRNASCIKAYFRPMKP